MRYCEKCDKCFDNDCYFCSYCGSKLDYRDDIEPEGFWKSFIKYRGHFFSVLPLFCVTMFALWFRDTFKGMSIIQVLAYVSGLFGIYNLMWSSSSKDEALFCEGFSNLCFVICIVCGILSS